LISTISQLTHWKMVSAPYASTPWTIWQGISKKMRNRTDSRFSRPGIAASRTG
jgi:hypothetical protein